MDNLKVSRLSSKMLLITIGPICIYFRKDAENTHSGLHVETRPVDTSFVLLPPLSGSRDGAVLRALPSHQCGPGSIPGLGVICGLKLFLVFVLAPRFFFFGHSSFPLSTKNNILKFQFDLERTDIFEWVPRALWCSVGK